MRVRATRPELLGRPDLRHLERAELDAVGRPDRRARAWTSWSPAPPSTSRLRPDQRRPLADGTTDVQTFYLAQSGPNLVFHADQAERVYIQSRSLFLTGDGTIVSSASMGAGTIYTVVSDRHHGHRVAAAPSTAAPGPPVTCRPSAGAPLPAAPPPLPAGGRPGPADHRRHHRAERPTRAPTTRSRPSSSGCPPTSATPPTSRRCRPAPTPSTSFLFGSRRGYCEQISTATVVMLRIARASPPGRRSGTCPAPTTRSPTSTKCMPTTPTPGCRCGSPATDGRTSTPPPTCRWPTRRPGRCWPAPAGHFLGRLPWIPIGLALAAVSTVVVVVRRRRRRPPTWAHRVAADLDRGGAPSGRAAADGRDPDRLRAPAGRRRIPVGGRRCRRSTGLVERYSYAGVEPSADRDRPRPGLHPPVRPPPTSRPRSPRHTRRDGGGRRPRRSPIRPGPRPAPRRTRRRRPAAAGRP